MQKVTRADLEQQGFHVAEVGEEEPEAYATFADGQPLNHEQQAESGSVNYESMRLPPPRYKTAQYSKADDDAKLFMKVATLALKVLALRVLLFGAGGMASLLFYQVVQNPDQAKIVSALLFTVLVFLPTLYYSSKTN